MKNLLFVIVLSTLTVLSGMIAVPSQSLAAEEMARLSGDREKLVSALIAPPMYWDGILRRDSDGASKTLRLRFRKDGQVIYTEHRTEGRWAPRWLTKWTPYTVKSDGTILFKSPFFGSEFEARLENGVITGKWNLINNERGWYATGTIRLIAK